MGDDLITFYKELAKAYHAIPIKGPFNRTLKDFSHTQHLKESFNAISQSPRALEFFFIK